MDRKYTNRGGYFRKLNGFAVSGVLYPMLILILFLTVQTLVMMSNRKNILDQEKQKLLESVNAANQVYTNEELSSIVDALKERQNQLEKDASYYEPKDLTEVYSPSELKTKVEKGDFSGLHIGDYFKVKLPDTSPFDTNICLNSYQSTNYIQIAGFDSYMGFGSRPDENSYNYVKQHHIVFVFKNAIAACKYNTTDDNKEGYPASELKKEVEKLNDKISSAKNGNNEKWSDHIISYDRITETGGQPWVWQANTKLFLLQEVEVTGAVHFGHQNGYSVPFQLPLFAYYGDAAILKYYNTDEFNPSTSTDQRYWWWLETPSIVNTTNFSRGNIRGIIDNERASTLNGLVPAFLFG